MPGSILRNLVANGARMTETDTSARCDAFIYEMLGSSLLLTEDWDRLS